MPAVLLALACAGGPGARHLLVPARQSVDASRGCCVRSSSCWRRHRRRRHADLRRALPAGLAAGAVRPLGVLVITALIARAHAATGRAAASARRAAGQRTEVHTAFLEAWIDHATGDVGGTGLDRPLRRARPGHAGRRRRCWTCMPNAAGDADLLRVLESYLDRRLGRGLAQAQQAPPRGSAQRHDTRGGAGRAGPGQGATRRKSGRASPSDPAGRTPTPAAAPISPPASTAPRTC